MIIMIAMTLWPYQQNHHNCHPVFSQLSFEKLFPDKPNFLLSIHTNTQKLIHTHYDVKLSAANVTIYIHIYSNVNVFDNMRLRFPFPMKCVGWRGLPGRVSFKTCGRQNAWSDHIGRDAQQVDKRQPRRPSNVTLVANSEWNGLKIVDNPRKPKINRRTYINPIPHTVYHQCMPAKKRIYTSYAFLKQVL